MPKGPKGTRIFTRGDREAYAMIAPFFLFFIVFVLIPIGVNIVNSFTNYNLDTKKWVGLRNYARLFQDAYFLRSLRNTAVYAIFSVIPLVIIGFVAAMVVKRQTRAMFAARALLMFPYVSSMVPFLWYGLSFGTHQRHIEQIVGGNGYPRKKVAV
ncbi:MAG: carbohydrate ABC transporter permease [Clostridia bacterium]